MHDVVRHDYGLFDVDRDGSESDPELNYYDDGDGYRFDIRLQGPTETVFFDV